MSVGAFNVAHWPILLKALIPQALFRYAILLGLVLWAVADLLAWVTGWETLDFFGVLGAMLFTIVALLLLPPQWVSLASARPVRLLGNNRLWLFGVALAVSGLLLVGAISFFTFMGGSFSPAVLWLMASLLLMLGTWLCTKASGIHGIIYAFNWLFADLAHWLDQWSVLQLVLVALMLWAVFALWWFRWQPKKYQRNTCLMPLSEIQKQQPFQPVSNTYWVSGRAASWLGSRLLGTPDGWAAKSKQTVLIIVFLLLLLLPGMVALERMGAGWIGFAGFALFVTLTAILSGTHASVLFNHLRLVWLVAPVNRTGLLALLWRRYWLEVLPQTLLLLVFALLADLFLQTQRDLITVFLLVAATLVFQVLAFWLTGWLYLLRGEGQLMAVVFGGLVFPLWLFAICATGLLFPLPFAWQGISIHWLWCSQLFVLALLYLLVRKGFENINLVRLNDGN